MVSILVERCVIGGGRVREQESAEPASQLRKQ